MALNATPPLINVDPPTAYEPYLNANPPKLPVCMPGVVTKKLVVEERMVPDAICAHENEFIQSSDAEFPTISILVVQHTIVGGVCRREDHAVWVVREPHEADAISLGQNRLGHPVEHNCFVSAQC
ncbi:unnamed protein product [Phytophthora fragariaefolia]|uniref:Unnamed protein product n=1 Tax=Phytophthora fragariaefolia TaxID=1490495 RepID=A0A9W6XVY9_9STRA|nr:unnamed protein product [Phytophthora fragariaefolia]